MAVTKIEISTSQLKKDTERLRTTANNAKQELENFKNELDALNGMWQGRANIAFRGQVSQDYALMQEMLEQVNVLILCMENACTEYIKCENDVKNIVDTIRI